MGALGLGQPIERKLRGLALAVAEAWEIFVEEATKMNLGGLVLVRAGAGAKVWVEGQVLTVREETV